MVDTFIKRPILATVVSLVFVLAQQYGIYTQRATTTILVTTLLSVVTLSVLFLLLGVQR